MKPLRISSLRTCPRMTAYYALETPARARRPAEERILFSGHRIGRDRLLILAEARSLRVWDDADQHWWIPPELRAPSREEAGIIAEKQVTWELGIGHEDAYLPADGGSVLEILSSSSASASMAHSKLLQLVLYMHYDQDEPQAGALLIVDPRDYSDETIVVARGSARFRALEEEALARVEEIRAWRSSGELPARVCRTPHDSETWWCRVVETCFEGWEEPAPAEELPAEVVEEAAELAERWNLLKLREQEPAARLKSLQEERKGVESELANLAPAGESAARGWRINRSVRHKDTFKLKLAEEDSRIPLELLGEFTRRTEFSVWTIEGAPDPGEEAPF